MRFKSDLLDEVTKLIDGTTFEISEDPQDRAIQLTNLILTADAVQKMGWHTHTSDWDWSAEITLRDGGIFGENQDVYGDTFMLVGLDIADGQPAACIDFSNLEALTVLKKEHENDEVVEAVDIPVENIKSIKLYYE